MRSKTRRALSSLALLVLPEVAHASGDVTVLFLAAGQILLCIGFVIFLATLQSWRERLILATFFFVSFATVVLGTSNVGYSENRAWLVPVLLGVPTISWLLGIRLLRSLRQRRQETR